MPFDEKLVEKVRLILANEQKLTERRMFGGLAFLINGTMCCGVDGQDLIARVDPARHDHYISQKHTREFDLSGKKTIRGWLIVESKGLASNRQLSDWVKISLEFAKALPVKNK